jgi:hypothetical protein
MYSILRGLFSLFCFGYIGMVVWNVLVFCTPLRIWYKPLPYNFSSCLLGLVFCMSVGLPVVGFLALATGHNSMDNGSAGIVYGMVACTFLPFWFWQMRQETLAREGKPNRLWLPGIDKEM